jgi:hypothetical protein
MLCGSDHEARVGEKEPTLKNFVRELEQPGRRIASASEPDQALREPAHVVLRSGSAGRTELGAPRSQSP